MINRLNLVFFFSFFYLMFSKVIYFWYTHQVTQFLLDKEFFFFLSHHKTKIFEQCYIHLITLYFLFVLKRTKLYRVM